MKRASVVVSLLLAFGLANGCNREEAHQQTAYVQHDPLEYRRAAYTAKINTWLTRQWGGGAEYSGDVLTLVEGGANVRDEVALACVVAQLQVPPPPYFRKVRIVTANVETRSLEERISASLPINRPISDRCEVLPPAFFN